MYSEEQYYNALYASFRVNPQTFDKGFFKDYQTITQYYGLLTHSAFDQNFINRVLKIIQPYIDGNKRFRRKSFVKLLKAHLKKRPPNRKLKPETIARLFRFYESQILTANEELANDLSVTIRNLELGDENIKWLIQNARESNYILNRLLRYPVKSCLISDWAKHCFEAEEFSDRNSEIMGYILDMHPTYEFKNVDKNKIAWAVFYSRIDKESKQEMLKRLLSPETADSIITISERLKFNDILQSIWR